MDVAQTLEVRTTLEPTIRGCEASCGEKCRNVIKVYFGNT